MRSFGLLLIATAVVGFVGCNSQTSTPVAGPSTVATAQPIESKIAGPAAASTGEPAIPPADFTVSLNDWAKEKRTSGKAFDTKYAGKRVELTGSLLSLTLDRDVGFVLHGTKEPETPAVHVRVAKSERAKYQALRALSLGQAVTVRGKVEPGDVLTLSDAQIVKVGPTTAVPGTVAAVVAAYAKVGPNPFDGKDVVLRAEVRKNELKEGSRVLTLADPGKAEPTLEVRLAMTDRDVAKEWAELKSGSILIVLGDAAHKQLHNARILALPPEGVTLPATKP